ncbi:hypothetical protein [Halorubellus sp. PRR65]|uniref:DUF7521 family protein n=1 Tax=Halorubellus sp. PRR65 TaxID=3098148 RepID=UPI002B258093|nr:hypothetical protein [Halorubellus sp. PRR65]
MLGVLPPPGDLGRALVAADATAVRVPLAADAGSESSDGAGSVLSGLDPLQVVLLAMALASTALGLYVGYQAYRGFVRNDSTPMKFLSLGLVLLTAVTFGLSFGGSVAFQYDLAPAVLRPAWQVAVRGSQLAGVACIVYALHRRP